MLYFIPTLLISIMVPILLRCIICKIQSTKISSPYTFQYPHILSILYLVPIVLIVGLFIWANLSNHRSTLSLYIFLYTFYAIFVTALIWAFLKTLRFQLTLEDDHILYRNIFGSVKTYKYEDITKLNVYHDKSNTPVRYKIYIGKRKIEVDNFMINFHNFPKLMKKRLKKFKNPVQF